MIENTDEEQIVRLNARIEELLRKQDGLVKALEEIDKRLSDFGYLENYPSRKIARGALAAYRSSK